MKWQFELIEWPALHPVNFEPYLFVWDSRGLPMYICIRCSLKSEIVGKTTSNNKYKATLLLYMSMEVRFFFSDLVFTNVTIIFIVLINFI